jgi:uncharacterized protein YbjT (DUF2867 family)
MNIIIYGSTGGIGRQLIWQALELGHSVTAFARDKQKLDDMTHPDLEIFEGDVLNFQDVLQSVKGHNVVMVTPGAGRKGMVRSEGTRNIVKAMEMAGIKRLICQSAIGAGNSIYNLNFFWRRIMYGWLLKAAYIDHQLQEQYIRESGLHWTIVRPGAFTNGKLTGHYNHGFASNNRNIRLKISRPDVALFMLMQICSNAYIHKSPAVSY